MSPLARVRVVSLALVAAAILPGCGDPVGRLQRQVERLAGEAVADCGGPSFAEPEAEVDYNCVASAAQAGSPYLFWSEDVAPTREGDPLYEGRFAFRVDEEPRQWLLEDNRADAFGGGLYVTRCVVAGGPGGDTCEPRECVADCHHAP